MASRNPISCGPCHEGNVNTKAEYWCYNCDEGLCSTCSGHHKRSKSSRDHKTIDIKMHKPFVRVINTECDQHFQDLNLYCPSHLMPCCDECIFRNHSKCNRIKSLARVVEKTKIEEAKESVEKDINSILHLFDKMVNNKSTNIKTGELQCEIIKESIVKTRKKINKYLDKLGKETDNLCDKETSTARQFISEVKGKKKIFKEMKEHLHAVTTNTSKLQSFLGIHQIEQQVQQYQRYVEDLEDDDRSMEFEIKMKQNDGIENILKKLGFVKVETVLNRETNVRRKAQVESREQLNTNNMIMNIEKKIEINIEESISDMICLMDGRLIVVEQFGKVNLLTSDGKLQKQLPLPGEALHVTQINQNTLAITYPEEKAIKIFNMENETVTKVITLNKICRNLSFCNNSLALDLSDDEIRIIDLEGNTLKSIPVESESYLEHLVYCNDRVIFSDYAGKAVTCVDESGKQIWRYTQNLSSPTVLRRDTFGNIILVDYNANRIIVIAKDGNNSKVLISEEDELYSPQCICFKHNKSSGFICDSRGTYFVKFHLSYQ